MNAEFKKDVYDLFFRDDQQIPSKFSDDADYLAKAMKEKAPLLIKKKIQGFLDSAKIKLLEIMPRRGVGFEQKVEWLITDIQASILESSAEFAPGRTNPGGSMKASAYLSKFDTAIEMSEHMFQTPDGLKQFKLQLAANARSLAMTIESNILVALINASKDSSIYNNHQLTDKYLLTGSDSNMEIDRVFSEFIAAGSLNQGVANGFTLINKIFNTDSNRLPNNYDAVIIPEHVVHLFPELKNGSFAGKKIYDVATNYAEGAKITPGRLLTQNTYIPGYTGAFFDDIVEYGKIINRSVYIYSFENDNFGKISLVDAVEKCGRFDKNGNLDSSHAKLSDDLFIDRKGNLIDNFGDMREEFLDRRILSAMIENLQVFKSDDPAIKFISNASIKEKFRNRFVNEIKEDAEEDTAEELLIKLL